MDRLVLLVLAAFLPGCCLLRGYRTPEGIERWQDTTAPSAPLHAKARVYQERLEAHHRTPEGVVKYRRRLDEGNRASYEDLADGCFHTGIYLASQALRYAATREPAALEEARHALAGLETLMEVTGKPGLLARHISPAGTISGGAWLPSTTLPRLAWRSDVSKDQYAGFIHGIGCVLALVDDRDMRARAGRLAAAAADHIEANDLRIVDVDGSPTTHGDLRGRFIFVPIGVNALIALSIAKCAAAATGEPRHEELYRRLIRAGYHHVARCAHVSFPGLANPVNDHMAYLALYPLLLLEEDPRIAETLRAGERRSWSSLRDDGNAFFAFIHAAVAGDAPGSRGGSPEAVREGLQSLREFPEDKVELPVDLTRPGFDFPRAFFNTRKCEPRTTARVPLYLRARTSSFWASEPSRLASRLEKKGNSENAGMDYLVAYWMGRYHGFIGAEE